MAGNKKVSVPEKKSPAISVVMSVYNGELYIKKAIDSILTQTFNDFEFIIINDASTDSTELIIKAYNDSRIKSFNNIRNLGLTKSLNIGLDLAKGKYIARMDADDISLPERLQKQFEFMEKHLDVDVCGSWYELFGTRSGMIETPAIDVDIRDTLFFNNCIAHPSVIMRKDSFEKDGVKYDENLRSAQDYELWSRQGVKPICYANIPEILIKYRVHENQVGFAKKKEQDEAADRIRVANLNKIGISLTDEQQRIYLNVTKHKYDFMSKKELVSACVIMDKICMAGLKYGYGEKFKDIIKAHLSNIAEVGIRSGKTSLMLFFTIFSNNKIFSTKRAKIRYLFHSLRNVFHA